jgi:diguanylate cyclase (GGDEF)-like protein/PAS domain S-box-containing protein
VQRNRTSGVGVDYPAVLDAGQATDLSLATALTARWEIDLRDGRLRWSPTMVDVVGVEAAGLATVLLEIVDPLVSAARSNGDWQPYQLEHEHLVAGLSRSLRVHAVPFGAPDLHGAPSRLAGIVVDISQRHTDGRTIADLIDRYRLLVELSPDGLIVHQNGVIVYANPSSCRFAGAAAESDLLGHHISDFVDVASRQDMLARIAGLTTAGAVSVPAELSLVALDGSRVVVESTSVRTTWVGRPAFQVILRDLSAQKDAEAARRLAEQRFATVVASLQEGVVVLGRDGRIESVNPAAEELVGQLAEALIGSPIAALKMVDRGGNMLLEEACPGARARATGEPEDLVVGLRAAEDDRVRWLSLTAHALLVTARPNYSVVLSFSDVTERLAAAAILEHQATHDPLTTLANRTLIIESLTTALASLDRDGGQLSVVFIDLDHFKVINDSLSHGVGDKVLVEIGRRLSAVLRNDDVVGRLGGDEFVVMSRSLRTIAEAESLAERLRAAIASPMTIGGRQLTVNASAGVVAMCAPVSRDADAMLRDADVAMYQAKNRGRNRHELFDHALRARALRRLQLEEDLRLAIGSDELWVAYQPIVATDTAMLSGTEALARWDHPTLGSIAPDEFIPVAEESGLIVKLGARVLELACEQTARWRSADPALAHLTVSVNLSARQLADPELVATVRDVLDRTGLPATALWLEITESMLMTDPESASSVLHALHAGGIRLSIDDFGTGYSSLAYLRRFPVEVLKIDRSFTMAMNESADDEAIIVSVTALAHTLGMRVVAEGVEDVRQLDKLRELGCDYVQGYFLGRPAAASAVRQTLLELSSVGRRHPSLG